MDKGAPTVPLETPEHSADATSRIQEASTSGTIGYQYLCGENGRPWAPVYQGGSYK
jgi:hypothetical protein